MVVCLLASPRVAIHRTSFSGVDLALGCAILAALSFAFSSESCGLEGAPEGERARNRDALFCGLAGGLAVGMKIPAIIPFALLTLWWGHRCYCEIATSRRARWTPLLVFLAAGFATGSYWYLRDLFLTGNPIYPAEIGPFAGPLTREIQRQTSLIGVLNAQQWNPDLVRVMLRKRMDWPLPLGVVALSGLLFAPVALFRLRTSRAPQRAMQNRFVLLLFACGALSLVLYPNQPFSGMANRPHGGMHHNIRYLIPVFMIGLSLAPLAIPRGRRWTTGAAAVFLAAAGHTLGELNRSRLILFALSSLFTLALLLVMRSRSDVARTPWLRGATLIACVSLLLMVLLRTPQKIELAAANHRAAVGSGGPLVGGWQALDALPDGARVAFVSNVPFLLSNYYSQFGRRLQLHPVPIDYEGRRRLPLYEAQAVEARDWWWEFSRTRDVASGFVDHLRESKVDFILVSRWALLFNNRVERRWPSQRAALRDSAKAKRGYADPDSEIYDLRAGR